MSRQSISPFSTTFSASLPSYGIAAGFAPHATVIALRAMLKGDAERDIYPAGLLAMPRLPTARHKLHVFKMVQDCAARGAKSVLLPCFYSHLFIREIQANSRVEVIDMLACARDHLDLDLCRLEAPHKRNVAIVVRSGWESAGLFEPYFDLDHYVIRYVIFDGENTDLNQVAASCAIGSDVDIIIPGSPELALLAAQLQAEDERWLDVNRVYIQHALQVENVMHAPEKLSFKIGAVGGVGPAATVDFMDKLIRNTPAAKDQDHLKILIEHNPQIPDRTAHLVGRGADPTLALFETCRRLEAGDADIIAIPCNTAHAFVEEIQPYLQVPILNMLDATAAFVRERFPDLRDVGVLATSGTLQSGVYRKALDAQGLTQIIPDADVQARVMNAIYGKHGAKAGFTEGECLDDIQAGVVDLLEKGAQVILLGCTELPLLLRASAVQDGAGRRAILVDPTDVLARRCIAYARGVLVPPSNLHLAQAPSASFNPALDRSAS